MSRNIIAPQIMRMSSKRVAEKLLCPAPVKGEGEGVVLELVPNGKTIGEAGLFGDKLELPAVVGDPLDPP